MVPTPLDSQELAALQDAMREVLGAPGRTAGATADPDVVPVALIADDRAADGARPVGLRIAERWAQLVRRRLRHLVGTSCDISVHGAELGDGGVLRHRLEGAWTGAVVSSGREGAALVAVGGAIVEELAARLLGGAVTPAPAARPPTRTALGLFTSAGELIADALATAWSDDQGCAAARASDPALLARCRAELAQADIVACITLRVSRPAEGWIQLFARPRTLIAPPEQVQAVPAAPDQVDAALARVPVQVLVELGRKQLPLRELGALRVGDVIALDRFVDDPVPVYCGGVLKARGQAAVCRGVIAVAIVAQHDQGEGAA
jgi:flagellar motor switch protein FliN/FliY